MADILIDSSVDAFTNDPREGSRSRLVVETNSSNIYVFYTDGDGSIVYKKSTDGGQTWGSVVTVAADATYDPSCVCVWFDKWTTGDSGTKIHIVFGDKTNEDIIYRSLDTASDTLSSAVIVATPTDLGSPDGSFFTQITKARGGNLYIYYSG